MGVKMNKMLLLTAFVSLLAFQSCNKENPVVVDNNSIGSASVIINSIPYKTEKYLRIPYTIKMWEFEKEGLKLQQITAFDEITKAQLLKIEKEELPYIYKSPLEANKYFTQDNINNYYFSIQLAIPLEFSKPVKVTHRFLFRDTVNNKDVTFEGAEFMPRLSETPIAISSPLKGKNLAFINQSSLGYHFYVLFFMNNKVFGGERFAFDEMQFNDDFTLYYEGDPKKNSSYFNYKDTLYAVADGKIFAIKDGRPENNGDAQDVIMNSMDELAGNYAIIEMAGGYYAMYGHCVPNSFLVKQGDYVKEGTPIALLGNSGNSTAPHLHFQITDGADFLASNGVPFVLKKYTKVADLNGDKLVVGPSVTLYNSMMEQFSIINIE